ncbi:MAG: DUF4258 domain-containing protein [candidate division NC10 bacterium]|nr:DUF4258 domain-containing protein [candidate division NC10 bacterium]MDE2321041.1 DUF4258 domain-containing protein [candidate division NC10 bacterium]
MLRRGFIDITVEFIREKVEQREFLLSFHAHQERQEEAIETAEIREALLDAEILESYPEDPRGASCLALGFSKGQPIHVVCGRSKSDWLLIITVYIPREPKWRDPRTRRREGVSE